MLKVSSILIVGLFLICFSIFGTHILLSCAGALQKYRKSLVRNLRDGEQERRLNGQDSIRCDLYSSCYKHVIIIIIIKIIYILLVPFLLFSQKYERRAKHVK